MVPILPIEEEFIYKYNYAAKIRIRIKNENNAI